MGSTFSWQSGSKGAWRKEGCLPFVQLTVALASELIHPDDAAAVADSFTDIIQNPCFQVSTTD